EQEAPAGDDVHEGADLGDLDRVVQGQEDQVGADRKAGCFDGDALEQRQLRIKMETRRRVMLARPDRIEAERADQPRLLERLGEPPRRIVALGMLRVEINAELEHGGSCSPDGAQRNPGEGSVARMSGAKSGVRTGELS